MEEEAEELRITGAGPDGDHQRESTDDGGRQARLGCTGLPIGGDCPSVTDCDRRTVERTRDGTTHPCEDLEGGECE